MATSLRVEQPAAEHRAVLVLRGQKQGQQGHAARRPGLVHDPVHGLLWRQVRHRRGRLVRKEAELISRVGLWRIEGVRFMRLWHDERAGTP